jgi:hypothetical protein
VSSANAGSRDDEIGYRPIDYSYNPDLLKDPLLLYNVLFNAFKGAVWMFLSPKARPAFPLSWLTAKFCGHCGASITYEVDKRPKRCGECGKRINWTTIPKMQGYESPRILPTYSKKECPRCHYETYNPKEIICPNEDDLIYLK